MIGIEGEDIEEESKEGVDDADLEQQREGGEKEPLFDAGEEEGEEQGDGGGAGGGVGDAELDLLEEQSVKVGGGTGGVRLLELKWQGEDLEDFEDFEEPEENGGEDGDRDEEHFEDCLVEHECLHEDDLEKDLEEQDSEEGLMGDAGSWIGHVVQLLKSFKELKKSFGVRI